MFIVVHHYIINKKKSWYNLRGLEVEKFIQELDMLQRKYKVVDLKTLAANKKAINSYDFCSVTFDDGLRDHYDIAGKLISRNIIGTFFPSACIFEGCVPTVIKMHIILSKIKTEEIIEKLEKYLQNQHLDKFIPIPRDEKITNLRPLDDVPTANLKATMQKLSEEMKNNFVDKIFKKIVPNENKFCADFFMSPNQLRELHQQGMVIGSHSYSHTALNTMDYVAQKKELIKSKSIIEDIIKAKINSISFPFGGYDQNTISIAKKLGFKYGVVFNHKTIKKTDNDLCLSNLDCNDKLPL